MLDSKTIMARPLAACTVWSPFVFACADQRKHLNDAVSAIVRAYRAKLGMSQEKLSVRAGLDRTFVSKIEKASRNPTIEAIFRLSEAFEVLPEDLLKEIREEYERRNEEDPDIGEEEGKV